MFYPRSSDAHDTQVIVQRVSDLHSAVFHRLYYITDENNMRKDSILRLILFSITPS